MFTGRRMHGKPCVSVCGGTMAADALIDTGALLALVDRTDRWHRISVNAFEQLRLPLVTSEAVLTELFHLLATVVMRWRPPGGWCAQAPSCWRRSRIRNSRK